jgi:ankyrin repeat protein
MPKRKLSAKAFLIDLRDGMSDRDLMTKYGLSSKGLHRLFKNAVDAGVMTAAELKARSRRPERAVETYETSYGSEPKSPDGQYLGTDDVETYESDYGGEPAYSKSEKPGLPPSVYLRCPFCKAGKVKVDTNLDDFDEPLFCNGCNRAFQCEWRMYLKNCAAYLVLGADGIGFKYRYNGEDFFPEWVDDVMELFRSGIDVNALDANGWTLLTRVSRDGYWTLAGLLLDHGARVDATDRSGQTPLMWAASNGHAEVAQLLLSRGARVNATQEYGHTALFYAIQAGQLRAAAVLINRGADVNAADIEGATCLMRASGHNQPEAAKLLLKNGADVNAVDKWGNTALGRAAAKGHSDVADMLMKAAANVSIADHEGRTPLYWACSYGHFEVVEMLLSNGAVNAPRKDGVTCLRAALALGHWDVAELLEDYGADLDVVGK